MEDEQKEINGTSVDAASVIAFCRYCNYCYRLVEWWIGGGAGHGAVGGIPLDGSRGEDNREREENEDEEEDIKSRDNVKKKS